MNGSTLAVPGLHVPCACVLVTCALLTFTGCAQDVMQDGSAPTPNVAQRRTANVITADDIAQSPSSTNIQEILQRYVPGFRVTGQSSRPGGRVGVSILGMGSPVFVLDGIILEQAEIALGLNPRDVERIEVLKHGASTAMFGFRGSNGAVVITTKC